MINYQFTLTNNGPDPIAGATLTDVLPSTVTFRSLTAPAGWTLSQPAVGASGTIMANDTASIAAGASATFTVIVQANSSTRAQVITNTASAGPTTFDPNTSNNSLTLTTTVPAPSPAGVDIHGQPTDGVIGQSIGGPITVAIVDANGNTIPTGNQLVTLAIATGPGGATLGGTTTVQAVDGVATFTNLTLSLAGTYTLTATGGSLTPDFSNVFTISPIDVTSDLKVQSGKLAHAAHGLMVLSFTFTNTSSQALSGPIAVLFRALPQGVTLKNATGTFQGKLRLDLLGAGRSLARGKHLNVKLVLSNTGSQRHLNKSQLLEAIAVLTGI